jgi:predicted DNA-binding transcriptional regulator AlpA
MPCNCSIEDRSTCDACARAPALLNAKRAASLVGVSMRTWWRLNSAAKIPAAVRVGHSKRWRVQELEEWIEAGCPDRRKWEAIRRVKPAGHV